MISIADLVETLLRVGEEAVKLENGYGLQDRLNRGELSARQFVEKSLALWQQFEILVNLSGEQAKRKAEAIMNGPEAELAYNSISDPAILAVRLLGHDDVYATIIMNNNTGGIISGLERKDDSYANKWLTDKLFSAYEVTRIYATVIPYLAAGNRRLLIANSSKDFPSALGITGSYLAKAVYNLDSIETVLSDEHMAIYQLLSNASTHLRQEGIDAQVVIGMEDYTENGIPRRVLRVTDTGLGIPPEILPRIFGAYSSRPHGSGLGLRVVKRIAELRGGYAKVTSTQQGSHTFAYNTATDCLATSQPAVRGTTFEVHLKALDAQALFGAPASATVQKSL